MTLDTPPADVDPVSLAVSTSAGRRVRDVAFRMFIYLAVLLAVVTLIVLIVDTFITGRSRLNWDLVKNMPSARPQRAGIQSAIWGSIWVVGTTALISLPLGIRAAI